MAIKLAILEKNRAFKTILILFIVAVIFSLIIDYRHINKLRDDYPRAEKGILDLLHWNFNEKGTVALKGDWEFYWQKLLNPGDFGQTLEKQYIDLPGSWNGYNYNGEELSGTGYATFRLRVKNSNNSLMGLSIPPIRTAYRLWVNGEQLTGNGLVASTGEKMSPQYVPRLVPLRTDADELDIVIQVANNSHRLGGIWRNIELGLYHQISSKKNKKLAFEMFLLGSLILMGIYHLNLYFYRRKELSSVYFGGVCLLLGLRTLLVEEMFLLQLFPEFNWELQIKFEFLTYYLGIPLFLAYIYQIYREKMSKTFCKIIYSISGVYSLLVLLTPAVIYTRWNYFYQIITIIIVIYVLYVLIKASHLRDSDSILTLIGVLFLAYTTINDIFYFNEVVLTENLTPVGIFVFIFIQSLILSRRYQELFLQTERLALEKDSMLQKIKNLNANLEATVKKRTRKLKETINKLNQEIKERKKVEEKLKDYASTDSMTGVCNRKTGIEFLKQQLNLARRNKDKFTICFIDIDDLKKVNDQYGHLTGDDYILTVVDVLQERVRSSDIISRFGGDEFLIIFPETSVEKARLVYQRIIYKMQNKNKKKKYRVSISHGFAEYSFDRDQTLDQLLETADSNMYQEKKEYHAQDKLNSSGQYEG